MYHIGSGRLLGWALEFSLLDTLSGWLKTNKHRGKCEIVALDIEQGVPKRIHYLVSRFVRLAVIAVLYVPNSLRQMLCRFTWRRQAFQSGPLPAPNSCARARTLAGELRSLVTY